jgi:FkbM family methyltransferase
MTCLDVGANFGLLSLVASDAVGPEGAVHAFELQPHLAAMLERSTRPNRFNQLCVHHVALSDRDIAGPLPFPASWLARASGWGVFQTSPPRVVIFESMVNSIGRSEARLYRHFAN